jgi:uncharacterized repeat protein (TIGR03803 family)
MSKLNWGMRACGIMFLWAAAAVALRAQTLITLHRFDNTDGANPYAALAQGTDGNFYGTTPAGGTSNSCTGGCGTIFKITPRGVLTTLHSFDGTDGTGPTGGLVQATDGNFYGTAPNGGTSDFCPDKFGCGTVFKITPSGTLTILYSFCAESDCADGRYPFAGLVRFTNGDLYGTTFFGGATDHGMVFKITPSGTVTTLHSFNGIDGNGPYFGALFLADNGDFYGTTNEGGALGGGTVFQMTPSGTLTNLHTFRGGDGFNPQAGVVQGPDGNFYGTTSYGGAIGCNIGCGTVFKITPGGTLTTLHEFCPQIPCPDGSQPIGGVVLGTNGNFYGTASLNGAGAESGTVFQITPSGTLTTLHSFHGTDGSQPTAGLLQGTDGNFYGTTRLDNANSAGTIFSLSVGLSPFVETQPTSGKVGAPVKILGTNLTGATSVTFNGTAAVFAVARRSLITTTVPAGATTGTVQVVTPNGTLLSNAPFRVRP